MSSRTPAPVRNIHNHHQLQQKLQKRHPSLRGFLMPSNSTDFNQILNRASSEHMQTIQNVIKDTSPSQEHPQSSSTPAKTPEMSSIFDRVLDAFKLNRFQPNFKQGFLRAYADHPKPSSTLASTEPFGWSTAELSLFIIIFQLQVHSNLTAF